MPLQIPGDFSNRGFIAFLAGQREQLGGFVQATMEAFQPFHDRLQLRAFLAQSLSAFRVIPDSRLL
jgi:hypothetical protein